MVYSSSGVTAPDSSFYFLKKQFAFSAIGVLFFAFFMAFDYKYLRGFSRLSVLASLVLLVLVLFIGRERGGAQRWIGIGPLNFQPSELAKFSIVLFLADYLDRKKSRIKDFKNGLVPATAVTGTLIILIALEPDIGIPAVIVAVMMGLFFVAGARPLHLLNMCLAVIPVFVWQVLGVGYRRERLFAFLDPWKYNQGTAYQLIQSLMSLGSGGITGKGIGQSELKNFYLPGQHTDFIFSVIGEEMGIIGTLMVLGCMTYLLMRGYKIAKYAPDLFSKLLALGITLSITLQAFFNIAVCCGMLPTKGISLPFISYGGSSIVITLAAVGVLANISQHRKKI